MKAVYNILNNQDKVTMKHVYRIIYVPGFDEDFCDMRCIPCAFTAFVEKLSKLCLPNLIKSNNHVMLWYQKHVSSLPSHVAIINVILPN